MVHEVALVEGLKAGGRALLERFSPAELKAAGGSGPFGAWRRWKELEARYEELASEGPGLSEVLFGKGCARAYAAAALRLGGNDDDLRGVGSEEAAEATTEIDVPAEFGHLRESRDGEQEQATVSTKQPRAMCVSKGGERRATQATEEREDDEETGSFAILLVRAAGARATRGPRSWVDLHVRGWP
jgi:hypothetical protein